MRSIVLKKWSARRLVAVAIAAGLGVWGLARIAASATPENGHWLKPVRERASRPLLMQGTLSPVNAVDVIAPVDGVLLAKYVQSGDPITVGQKLAQVNDVELKRQLRDAEIAEIQAQQALTAAKRLESSTEYRAAARRLLAAKNALAGAQRRGAEAQTLYDKGIIARTELDAARQEIDGDQSQVDGAHDEITTLEFKRSGEALRILELDLENRQLRLDEMRVKLKATTMLSPIAGVALYPAADGNESSPPKEVKAGAAVTTKDVILSVGDTSAFLIKAWVDEEDARQISPGQAARVTLASDEDRAFDGEVQRVSSQARSTDGRAQNNRTTAEFEVRILLRPPLEARERLHVGSTVTVSLIPEPGPATLRIPLNAVTWSTGDRPVVSVRQLPSDKTRLQPIEVKRTLVDSVEVKSGITERDEVWVPATDPKPGTSGGSGLLNRMLPGGDNA